ncbi:MAG: hypothetical protein RLZZ337_88 [Bacteroidota bacterium]|jgi:hypothetical protein
MKKVVYIVLFIALASCQDKEVGCHHECQNQISKVFTELDFWPVAPGENWNNTNDTLYVGSVSYSVQQYDEFMYACDTLTFEFTDADSLVSYVITKADGDPNFGKVISRTANFGVRSLNVLDSGNYTLWAIYHDPDFFDGSLADTFGAAFRLRYKSCD